VTISIYMCISWNFIQYIIDDFKILDLDKDSDGNFLEYTPKMWLIRGICMVAVMLIILPLSLLKDMSSLRFMAIINLMVLFYVIVVNIFPG
jgi:amino acid permease